MTASLDQQLQDLCDIHGLTAISLTAYNADHGKFFGVTVQTVTGIGSGLGGNMGLTEAFKAALADLHVRQALSVPAELSPLEVAA